MGASNRAAAPSIETEERQEIDMPVRTKAWTHSEYGSPEVLELRDIDIDDLEPDQMLVAVKAASVNPFDWHMMTGSPFLVRLTAGMRRPKNPTPGADYAGVVEAVGESVTEFSVGDAVFGSGPGAFRRHTRGRERSLAGKPASVSFEDAATVGIAGQTALQGLRDKGGIRPGTKVLVNGASGGVGTFAVQIAKALGAEVTAVCSTRNLEMVEEIGADRVIDYTTDDFTRSGKYDLVFDAVGTRSLFAVRRLLGDDGVYVAASAPKHTGKALARMLRMWLLSLLGRKKMKGFLAKHRKEDLAELMAWIEAGDVTPVIDRTLSFTEVPDAMRHQGEGHARGKTVIVV